MSAPDGNGSASVAGQSFDTVDPLEAFVTQLGGLISAGALDQAVSLVDAAQLAEPVKYHLGMTALANARGDLGGGLGHAQKAQQLAPDAPIVLQYLAVSFRMVGDLVNAERAARMAVMRDATVRSYTMLGKILLDAGKLDEADGLLMKALDWEPSNPALLNTVATVRAHLGDDDSALTFYARAFEASPEEPLALKNVSDLYAQRGWALGAMALGLAALDRPATDDVQVLLAIMVIKLAQLVGKEYPGHAQLSQADRVVDVLVERSRSRPPAVVLMAARVLADVGRGEQAQAVVAHLRADQLSDKDHAGLMLVQGQLADQQGEVDDAIDYYSRSVQLDGERWDACTNAVHLLLSRENAESDAEVAVLLGQVPETAKLSKPPLLLNEAIYLRRAGREDEARVRFEQVVRLTQGSGELGALAQRLLAEVPAE